MEGIYSNIIRRDVTANGDTRPMPQVIPAPKSGGNKGEGHKTPKDQQSPYPKNN